MRPKGDCLFKQERKISFFGIYQSPGFIVTTAAITINENADPDVRADLKLGLNDTFPNKAAYIHMEGNSDGHMKSSVVGVSEILIISEGHIILGTWQSVYICEFDDPRTRTVHVKIIEG